LVGLDSTIFGGLGCIFRHRISWRWRTCMHHPRLWRSAGISISALQLFQINLGHRLGLFSFWSYPRTTCVCWKRRYRPLRPLCSIPRKQINAPRQHRQHPPLNRQLIARSMAEFAHALVCLSEGLHNPSYYNVYFKLSL
jgi:hypothetical protein